jgi:hypothetical protein
MQFDQKNTHINSHIKMSQDIFLIILNYILTNLQIIHTFWIMN